MVGGLQWLVVHGLNGSNTFLNGSGWLYMVCWFRFTRTMSFIHSFIHSFTTFDPLVYDAISDVFVSDWCLRLLLPSPIHTTHPSYLHLTFLFICDYSRVTLLYSLLFSRVIAGFPDIPPPSPPKPLAS